jgi:hypothetical protein
MVLSAEGSQIGQDIDDSVLVKIRQIEKGSPACKVVVGDEVGDANTMRHSPDHSRFAPACAWIARNARRFPQSSL